MRVLITGGTGFIGKAVINRLTNVGHQVLAISRDPPINNLGAKWIGANLCDVDSYAKEIENFSPEGIIHLAWDGIPDFSSEKSFRNLKNSINFFKNLFKIKTVKKILVAGSCFELGAVFGEVGFYDEGVPKDHFTWSKHSLRIWLEEACNYHSINFAWMRLFYVYGEHQREGSLIPSIIKSLRLSQAPNLKFPNNALDFVYVGDVANAFAAAVSSDFKGGIYNVGSGYATKAIDVSKLVELAMFGNSDLTDKLARKIDPNLDNLNFYANIKRTTDELGWRPSFNLADGINETLLNMSENAQRY